MVEATPRKTCTDSPPGQFLKGIREFNQREWYECHETVEELWMGARGEVRHLYQGIIQISVALHHWRNGNFVGAVSLLESGADYLRQVPEGCLRVDVSALIGDALRFRDVLLTLGPEEQHTIDQQLVPLIATCSL